MKKNILIIGGSKGIGGSLVTQLQESHVVYVAARTSGQLDLNKVHFLPFDVLTQSLEELSLPEVVDAFVYCPGTINLRPINSLKIQNFQDDMELNFFSLVRSFKAVLPRLQKSSQGVALFFSTVASTTGMPYHASISAAKGAIEAFARSIAAELAPKIRVNVIAPSLSNTELASKFLNNEAKMEQAKERNPLKMVGDPVQLAKTASFLISEDACWITGQVIHVDGGMSTLKIN